MPSLERLTSLEQRVKLACGRRAIFAQAVVFALALAASAWQSPAQNSQFTFDPPGNLITQTTAADHAPVLNAQPQPQIVAPGESASFLVALENPGGVTYQWFFNNSPLPGATKDTLLLDAVSNANEGPYFVVVANAFGSVTSAPAPLMLDTDGDGMSDSWEATYFSNLNQTASGDFDQDGVSNYQEFLDGTDPTDPNSAQYRLTLLTDGGSVSVTPSKSSYTNGETVMLSATAFPPNSFHGWRGDIFSDANPVRVVMDTNKTIVAYLSSYDITWTSFNSGDWFSPTNWSPNIVPASNDNVFVTQTANVVLNGNATCRDMTLGGPGSQAVGGTGDLTILDTFTWTQGAMIGSGRTILPPGATLNVDSSIQATLRLRTLENAGTINWTGGGGIYLDAAVITNCPGAVIRLNGAGSIFNLFGTSSSRFDNSGTFIKSASASTCKVDGLIALNNFGTIDVQSGALSLVGGGTNAGTIHCSADAGLWLSGAFGAGPASSMSGDGFLSVGGGPANLFGYVNFAGENAFTYGIANLMGQYFCTNNSVTISGGTANFNGTGLVSPAVVNLSNGALSGTNTVTVLNQMNWVGGGMSGAGRTFIPAGATLSIRSNAQHNLFVRTLDNAGTAIWSTPASVYLDSAVITNRPGALFLVQHAASILNFWVNASRFDNAGTLRETASTNALVFDVGIALNNYGTVDLVSGSVNAKGGYNSSSGALLAFSLAGTNAGQYSRMQAGGTANLAGALSVSFANGFEPKTDDSFTLLSAAQVKGVFVSFFYPSNDLTMQPIYTANSAGVRVTAVGAVLQPLLLTPQASGTNLTLIWTAISNRTYRVEFNPTLDGSSWTPVPGDVLSVSNIASKVVSLVESNQFYRVELLP